MKKLALLAFLALVSPAWAIAPIVPVNPVVIGDDPGGMLHSYKLFYERLARSGVPVRLEGICVSGCTLILSLPAGQVCVTPTAALGFHLATVDNEPDPGMTAAIAGRFYPPSVQEWLKGKTLRAMPIYMLAEEIVRLGVLPPCEAPHD